MSRIGKGALRALLSGLTACLTLAPMAALAQVEAPAPTAAGAQSATLRGVVLDPETGVPIEGATVIVLGTELATVTEADGSYEIVGVPAGTQQVQVVLDDHVEEPVTVELSAGQTLVSELAAKPSSLAGEVIVVTGTRSPEKIFDAPVTVEAVGEEVIARTAGPTYLSSLSNVKGIDFANAGLNDQRISMRGFTTQFNSRLITMVDGRLAQSPGNGLPQANLLPATTLDMKAMEVVVGPASALYGPNAHTGVINVLTKTPWDESGAALSLRGGTQDMIDGAVRLAGTVGEDFGWKLNAQYMRAEDFETDCSAGSPFRYGTDLCEADVLEDFHVDSFKTDGSLYYRFGDWMAKVAAGMSENTSFGATNAGRNHIRDWQISYQAAQLSHPNWYAQVTRTASDAGNTYQLHGLVQQAATRQDEGGSIAPEDLGDLRHATRFEDASQMLDGELQYREEFVGIETSVGLQARAYMPDSGGTYLADAVGTDIDAQEVGGYVQADYDPIPDKLRVVGALRVDTHSNYDPQVSPKLAAVLDLAPGSKLRVGYNRAFKSPTILENYLLISGSYRGNRDGYVIRDSADGGGGVVQTIDPLEPELVNSFEIGYKGYIGRTVFIDAVVYDSFYRNFIGPLSQVADGQDTFGYTSDGQLVENGTLFTYQNFGAAEVRGADIGVSVHANEYLSLSASTSFIGMVSNGEEAPPLNVSPAKFKFSVTGENLFLDNTFVRLAGRYSSAYDFASGVWVAEVPPIFVADITAGYTFTDLGVSLTGGVMNLFDNDIAEVPGAPVATPMAFLQMSYAYQGLNY